MAMLAAVDSFMESYVFLTTTLLTKGRPRGPTGSADDEITLEMEGLL